jgi:hypothetical protein
MLINAYFLLGGEFGGTVHKWPLESTGDMPVVFDWVGRNKLLVSFRTEKTCLVRKPFVEFRSASQVRSTRKYPCRQL